MDIKIISASCDDFFKLEQVEEIFFEASSKKEFNSLNEKKDFFNLWCGQYLDKYPEYFLIGMVKEKVLGYCCAHPDSLKALLEFKIPGQSVFQDEFQEYPVHLHINCHKDSRGMGIGRKLIEAQALGFQKGMHIITDRKADNYGFYKALGFNYEVESNFKGHSLLLMGRKPTKIDAQ